VSGARAAIAAGEVYQVNLVQHLSAAFDGDADGVATALRALEPLHPRPLHGPGWSIVSATPELFLERSGRRIRTMPIKGTRPRGDALELSRSTKDAAEHVMIVDLERNDLGRICEPGSVSWPELMEGRQLAGVEHLVSTVEGTARADLGLAETLAALFPGGSVTGAPKIAALDHINALEPVGRGASMGALGTVWPNGDFQLALTIRTFAIVDRRIHLWVGGGVVWDSDPAAEVEESWVKARPLLEALRAASSARVAA
jgi:para-aminobenzoate synthetase component 1